MMFARFENAYSKLGDPVPWSPSQESALRELEPAALAFLQRSTDSYAGGRIRFFTANSYPSLFAWGRTPGWIDEWPEMQQRLVVFGCDWLGRQFALDRHRFGESGALVSILEPGTGDLLEVPATFSEFINNVLVDDHEAASATSAFERWTAAGRLAPEHHECVGYEVPLFLGGSDTLDNMSLTDMEVYLDVCGQLFARSS